MTSFRRVNIQGDFEPMQTTQAEERGSANDEGIDYVDVDKIDGEFHLACETIIEDTPRSNHSKTSSSEVLSSIPKQRYGYRPKSGKPSTPRSPHRHISPLSSIPLPVKTSGPNKMAPILKNVRSSNKTSSISVSRTSTIANKHTLEIQFINKNKRYVQMRKEMVEKQRPVLDLYQSLVQIKKRLEELGKTVKLEDIKLLTYEEYIKPADMQGAGEQVSMEIVAGMKQSIEEIPKTLMDICKNLLSRRALIVELLESVTKSEVDVSEVSDKIESLKNEGQQLQHSLDAVIREHESKINVLVGNWQKLLSDKQTYNTDIRIEELESKLEHQESLTQESNNVIHELYRKMEEHKSAYDMSIVELNGVIHSLKEQIKKLEQELENEKKTTVDFKTRNNTNSQNLKSMRAKISDLENEKSAVENSNAEMQKKIRFLQDQIKHKEANWCREKDELTKNLKHQENLLQKLTADKNQFETSMVIKLTLENIKSTRKSKDLVKNMHHKSDTPTLGILVKFRLKTIEIDKNDIESNLQSTVVLLNNQLCNTNKQLDDITRQRNDALEKCREFENYIVRMRTECKETMNKVSYSIQWGKDVGTAPAAENYIQEIAKDLRIRELEDKIHYLENERMECCEKESQQRGETTKALVPPQLQQESISKYQLMLQESENILQKKLNDLRSSEIERLQAEITQLKVRQVALEEQNQKCPTKELQHMVEEGQRKLNELMKRSIESEHTVEKYVNIIEKQTQQINDMGNLLRYRENMANVLKTSRDELVQEKESIIRYSQEIRNLLAEVTKQGKMKECLARELQEKVFIRERQIIELKELVQKLESNLIITNEKRFKLQETVGILEQRLRNNQGRFNQSKNENQLHYEYPITKSDINDHNSLMYLQNQTIQNSNKLDVNSITPKPEIITERPSCKKCSPHVCNELSPKLRKISSQKMRNLNFSIFRDNSSEHLNCQHKANSRSLISLSLQTVDFLKTRLNFLTSVNMILPEHNDKLSNQRVENNQTANSPQTTRRKKISQENVGKIIKLSAKRYEYLQNQANESYEDLTKLVKLAVKQKNSFHK